MRARMWIVAAAVLCIVVLIAVVGRSRSTKQPIVHDVADAATNPASVSSAGPHWATISSPTASAVPPTDARRAECWQKCGTHCETEEGPVICPKECSRDADCGANRLCMKINSDLGRCVGSECTGPNDPACGPNETCNVTAHPGGAIWHCTKAGIRRSGEFCGATNSTTEQTCGQGLVCESGLCTPTVCDTNDDCPKGTRCATMPNETAKRCSGSCRTDGDCPEGDLCVTINGLDRRCAPARDAKTSCARTGCPDGQICNIEFYQAYHLKAECMVACDKTNPCAPGFACYNVHTPMMGQPNVCYPNCKLDLAGGRVPTAEEFAAACPEGYRCMARTTDIADSQCSYNDFDYVRKKYLYPTYENSNDRRP